MTSQLQQEIAQHTAAVEELMTKSQERTDRAGPGFFQDCLDAMLCHVRAHLLQAQGVDIDRRKIRLDEPIKTLGTFQVPVRLHRQVTAEIALEVVPESA